MGKKKHRPQQLDVAELKLTDREVLILDAIVFDAQRDHTYIGSNFRNIHGQFESIIRDDVVNIGNTFFRLSRFLRDSVR